ncbi:MAG: InlB B-repeat-containing protein, partial [Clostridia bacterium]|nr:InlB B-repeat-containing protein [Clostridia bacterium]
VTVTFNGNGAGSTVSTASASAYRTISRWDTAAAGNGTSYALSGSYTNNAALDLYAQWSAVTVDFSDTSTYTASRDGYTFDGWYTLAEGGSEVTSHEFAAANTGGSFEVFAHWTASTVTVTFNLGGHGTAISPVTDNAGFSLSKPADPTADGFIFMGWFDSTLTVPYTFPLVINADTILYAKWVKIERTLALTSAIDVYFMIPQSAFGAGKLDASTAKFTVNYVNRNGTGRSNATITAKSSATVDAVEYYVWVFSELNPAHLGENLVVTFYEGDTEKATLNYSVIEYCYNQIDEYEKDKTAAKLKTAKICAGIVRYGVAAETYALAAHGIEVYETSASEGFAALNLNSVTEYNYNSTSYNPTSVGKSNVAKKIGSDASGFTGFEWVSGALDLGHNVRIKLNFTYTGADASSYSVKVKYKNGDSTVTEDLGNLEDLAGAVYYDNFNPSEFGRTLQFAVYNSSGTRVSKVLQYSVYSYLLTASGKTGNIKTLADTLINYGDAVYRFVNGEPS